MSTFFTHWCLVYVFYGEIVSFCHTISRNFSLLHVYFFHALVHCLLFSRRECYVLLHHMQELLVASCLLFSRIGALSTFFTVIVFRSVTPYAGTLRFFMSTFFADSYLVYLFHGEIVFTHWCLVYFFTMRVFRSVTPMQELLVASCLLFSHGVLSTFFTVRVFRSVTPYAGTLRFFMSTFFTDWYLVYLFHGEIVSFCHTISRNFSLLHVYFFHALVPCLLFSRWESFVLLHHRQKLLASCLLFSRLGTLSTFFMVRVFRSGTPYAGFLRFIMSTFFTD